ncbi:MAG TPA: CDP-diacylglycerol--serine O-phosphatidyltransferase [Gemmatimonadaceae bacterium]|nr:CDP-diacylglycerol--serine O-phosphatidyltransferase [Gemmatimonadaceae bacterium]
MNEDPRQPRRAVLALPNGFTLASLFFGIFAIVTASKQNDHDQTRAAWFIVVAAVCDGMDGRVARATRSASRFGEELDSLVDAVSFGLAPALLMYFAVLRHEGWDWVFVFLFTACAVLRLARFNVMQAGRPKREFIGLPSPMAGGTLATYYWFSQTSLYNQTVLSEWPWQTMLRFLMVLLGALMISSVPYPAWPTFSARTLKGAVGLVVFVGLLFGLIFLPKEFFFPVGVIYVLYGILRAALLGMVDRDGEGPEPPTDDDLGPSSGRTRHHHGRHGRAHRPQGAEDIG